MPEQIIKAIDYIAFPRFIGSLVRDHQDFEGVRFTQSFPKIESEVPCIAYRMVSRIPGVEGQETRKPRYRDYMTEEDGSITQIFGQSMLCTYQFDCIAHTDEEADNLCWKFDWLMRNSVGLFLDLGANNVVFQEQVIDALLQNTSDFAVRSVRWMAWLDQIEARNDPVIQQIRLNILFPQEEAVETLTRANDVYAPDTLTQLRISRILYVSDPSPSGIARTRDYLPGIDFETWYEPKTKKTHLQWFEPGKRPAAGATYEVRYLYWTPVTTLYLPAD